MKGRRTPAGHLGGGEAAADVQSCGITRHQSLSLGQRLVVVIGLALALLLLAGT
ncbi:MAG TPA: hypothetical protein VGP46_08745 [Acidimicrobiales bacterium]|nr:hypothetical protein [Acidimicrobiales bacterium]